MIRLHVEPQTLPVKWRNFCKGRPPRSVALDGYVYEGPRFNPVGPWVNFNHHDEVSRLETRATCAQVLMALRQGMAEAFRNERGEFDIDIYVNDCDEDVSLSVALLRNHVLTVNTMNPLVNRLVFMEDMLDTTTGSYSFPSDLDSLREVMWVFYPYHFFRSSGGLDRRDASEFEQVIDDVGLRILSYFAGKSQKIHLDTRHEVISRENGWAIVREIGTHARVGVFSDGIKAFLAMRERPDGRRVFTICRSSQFVRFPVPKFCAKLNEAEGRGDGDLWGGGGNVIGSPRVHGSNQSLEGVVKIIREVMASPVAA